MRAAYFKDYYVKHKPKWAHFKRKRRSLQAGLPSTFTESDWQRSLEYFGYRCAYCGKLCGPHLAKDHFIPLSKGGSYTPSNIIPACYGENGCNNRKKDKEPFEFMESAGLNMSLYADILDYLSWMRGITSGEAGRAHCV